MADYYPLIARAIAALDPNAPGESRRALYERARTALIAQLRSVQPPLSESEIAREARPGGGGARSGGDALRRAGARPADPSGQGAAPPRTRPAPPPPRADR